MGHPVATEDRVKVLASSILTTKSVKLYLGTRKTKVALHEVPLYISLNHVDLSLLNLARLSVSWPTKIKPG